MAGLYDVFKTDPDLENNGTWIDYGDYRIKVANAGPQNKSFAKYAEAKLKVYRRALDTGTLDKDTQRELMIDIYAKTVIKGWETKVGEEGKKTFIEGIEGPEGDVLPFTVQNVLMTLNNLPALFLDLQEMAAKLENFRVTKLEEEGKN